VRRVGETRREEFVVRPWRREDTSLSHSQPHRAREERKSGEEKGRVEPCAVL